MNSLGGDDGEGGGKIIRFILSPLPPSKNRRHKVDLSGRRRFESGKAQYIFLSDEARQWMSRIWPLIPRFEIATTSYIHLSMEFHYPFFYKNQKLRIFDAPNMQEVLQDVICKRLGVNDNLIKSWEGRSVDDAEEKVVVVLKELVQ
jgi:hypothetical protein